MKRPNLWVFGGALLLVVGATTTSIGISDGGLVSSVSVIGLSMPSLFSVLLGVILIRIGTKPKRFARR